MSGHSKWSTIKRKKGKLDAQRGKVFARLIKEITVAVRQGGRDLVANPRLRTAVQAAKEANMPASNIEKAIKRGTGELPGTSYEEVTYEGYGPNGVAILVEAMTDNRNRTTQEMRYVFSKNGGHLGEAGCVSWMFDVKGLVTVEKDKCDEDELIMLALDAGAEDIRHEDDSYEVITELADFEAVRGAIVESGIEYVQAGISKIPQAVKKLEGAEAQRTLRLVEDLEEHDDVQKVFANFDIDEKIMEEMG